MTILTAQQVRLRYGVYVSEKLPSVEHGISEIMNYYSGHLSTCNIIFKDICAGKYAVHFRNKGINEGHRHFPFWSIHFVDHCLCFKLMVP